MPKRGDHLDYNWLNGRVLCHTDCRAILFSK